MLTCPLALGTIAALAASAPAQPPAALADPRPIETIVFLGDSLVHRSNQDHALLAGIRQDLEARHPGRRLELVDAGVNGDQIAEIRERLDRDVLQRRPGAVVLYWDSDVSDVDESHLAPRAREAVRSAYERDLEEVLSRLAASGAHVVVSGPTLIGERPHGRNPKDAQLDAYRDLTRRVCSDVGVHYVDTRHAFERARPHGASAGIDEGLLTEDGEHLNERGTLIVRRLFVEALDGWLRREHPDPPQEADGPTAAR